MDLPLKTFWMLHKNVDRISAEEDIRSAQVAINSQSGESIQKMMTDLREQMGTIVERMPTLKLVKSDPERKRRLNAIGDLKTNVHSR